MAAETNNFKVAMGLGPGGAGTINVVPRSLIGILNYLSQGVEVPAKDLEAGYVTRSLTDAGTPFDWQELLGEVFQVSSARTRPDNATLAVRYRNAWFYIPDNDLNSKTTFGLLSQLVALQAGNSKQEEMPISFSINR
jgi:hypothetical protein